MYPKRALVVTIAASISLWALTGLLPDRTAQAARRPGLATEQAADTQAPRTNQRLSAGDIHRCGDPDDLLQSGDVAPQPGAGSTAQSSGEGRTFFQVVLGTLQGWWSAVTGQTSR